MLALFFIFQTFLYSSNFNGAGEFQLPEVKALKAVFWILIFLVTVILYMETDSRFMEGEGFRAMTRPIFHKARFAKVVVRLLIYILVTIDAVLLFRELRLVLWNIYFSYLWVGIGVMILLELIRFTGASFKALRKAK